MGIIWFGAVGNVSEGVDVVVVAEGSDIVPYVIVSRDAEVGCVKASIHRQLSRAVSLRVIFQVVQMLGRR